MPITAHSLDSDNIPSMIVHLKNTSPSLFEGFELRFFYQGYQQQFDKIVKFAENHNLKFSLPGDEGLIGASDFDLFCIEFYSNESALQAVFCLLNSRTHTFDAKDFIELAQFAKKQLQTPDDRSQFETIIARHFEAALRNNSRLMTVHQSLTGLLAEAGGAEEQEAKEHEAYKEKAATLETLTDLIRQNQKIYASTRKYYNAAVILVNNTNTDIGFFELWSRKISELLHSIRGEQGAAPELSQEEEQEILNRPANRGQLLEPIGTSEIANTLHLEDERRISKMERAASNLTSVYQNNIESKENSLGWLTWLVGKCKALFNSLGEMFSQEETQDLATLMKGGQLADNRYIAQAFFNGTYRDDAYQQDSEQLAQNPIIAVLDAKNMTNALKHDIILRLIRDHGCDVNKIEQYSKKTPLEYLLASPNASLYLEKQGSEEVYLIAELLIKNGASLRPSRREAPSPLHYAAKSCLKIAPRIMDLMLSNGADVNYRTSETMDVYYDGDCNNKITLLDSSPLALAVISRNPNQAQLVKLLVDCGATKTEEFRASIQEDSPRSLTLLELYEAKLSMQPPMRARSLYAPPPRENEESEEMIKQLLAPANAHARVFS